MAVRAPVDQDEGLPAEAPASALLLTIPQTAVLLQIGESRCRELVAGHCLPVLILGPRSIRIPRAALMAWVAHAAQPAEDL